MRRRITALAIAAIVAAGVAWYASHPQATGPAQGDSIAGPADAVATPSGDSIRVGTFNIHGCVGRDGRRDVQRVAECLRDLDLAALNEVHGPRFPEADDQAAVLGRELGRRWLFAPATRDWLGKEFGNGLVTSLEVESWRRIPLRADNGRGGRNAVLACVRWRQRSVSILLTHVVRGDAVTRGRQLQEVVDMFLALPAPAVLLGDLNSEADEPEIRRLLAAADVVDAVGRKLGPDAPARIDWVFVRGLRVLDAGLRDGAASDHPLAWAELAVED
jgi:endonuclease/exonuclease/phosphatase family metal-dependent hydrolase